METYIPPEPWVAEKVYRDQKALDEQKSRLEGAPAEFVKGIARDPGESTSGRVSALLELVLRRDPELTELIIELAHDPDAELRRTAVHCCEYRRQDPRIDDLLKGLVDDPDPSIWGEATFALARRQNLWIQPRLMDWLTSGDEPHRNLAIEGLKWLNTCDARDALQRAWAQGGRDEGDRVILARALLDLGDDRGRAFLEQTARQAEGSWSVVAATAIYCRDRSNRDPETLRTGPASGQNSPVQRTGPDARASGLELMRWILDHGNTAAQQGMVNQIWNFARLPHAFTADGIHEARNWVDQQLQEMQKASADSLRQPQYHRCHDSAGFDSLRGSVQ